MAKYTIRFDYPACAGYFQCLNNGGDFFEEEPDTNKVILKGGTEMTPGIFELEIDETALEKAVAAANACPVNAIGVYDESGTVIGGGAITG